MNPDPFEQKQGAYSPQFALAKRGSRFSGVAAYASIHGYPHRKIGG